MINGQLIRLIESKKSAEKLNNRELAEKLKTTEFTIGNILRAKVNSTDPDLLQRILEWLQVKFAYIPTNSDSTFSELFHIPAGAMISIKLDQTTTVVCNPKARLVTGSPGILKRRNDDRFIYGKIHVIEGGFLVIPEHGEHMQISRCDVEFVAPVVEFKASYNPPVEDGESK